MLKRVTMPALFVLAPVAFAFPWYANGGFRGAELMSQQERQAHVARLQSMKTLNECHDYVDAHEAELQKRASAERTKLAPAKGDPCQTMLQMGRIKNN